MSKNSKSKNLLEKDRQSQEDIEMNPSFFNNNQSMPSDNKRFNVFSSQSSNNLSNSSSNVNFNSSLLFANNAYNPNQQINNVPRNLSMNLPVNPNFNNININNPNLTNMSYAPSSKVKDDKILLKANFEKLLNEKLNRYGLSLKQNNYNDILNTLNIGLDTYLKNLLEKLIVISRARNVNLNLYSKLSEKNPTFKVKTYNIEKQIIGPQGHSLESLPYKDFSILFSKNMKNILNNLETFEELNACKMKYDKISTFRNKIEEINQAKEREKEKQQTNKQSASNIANPPVKTRTRKRDTSLIKSYKNIFAKTQMKDEMDRQKKDIKHTLEAVLDTKTRYRENSSVNRLDTEMVSNLNESNMLETYTKLSEVSKSENPLVNADSNEIHLNIYRNYLPSDNPKFSPWIKRRITLKDLIFYLEGEKRTPCHSLLLHRAVLKLNQFSNY